MKNASADALAPINNQVVFLDETETDIIRSLWCLSFVRSAEGSFRENFMRLHPLDESKNWFSSEG